MEIDVVTRVLPRLERREIRYRGAKSILGEEGLARFEPYRPERQEPPGVVDPLTTAALVAAARCMLAYLSEVREEQLVILGDMGAELTLPNHATMNMIDKLLKSAFDMNSPKLADAPTAAEWAVIEERWSRLVHL
jgi:hypothetical protein